MNSRHSVKLSGRQKIKSLASMKRAINGLRRKGARIVFTNGCFDILHRGHVEYLKKARAQGEVLIVGLNTDASIRHIKGPSRPINGQADRAAVLAGLDSVDYVVLFGQDTPLELINQLKPDILVKGGDWHPEKIAGADIVKSYGGRVLSIPFIKGYSTSGLIEKIANAK